MIIALDILRSTSTHWWAVFVLCSPSVLMLNNSSLSCCQSQRDSDVLHQHIVLFHEKNGRAKSHNCIHVGRLPRDEIQILHMENVLILEKSYLLTESDSSYSLSVTVGWHFVYSRQTKKLGADEEKNFKPHANTWSKVEQQVLKWDDVSFITAAFVWLLILPKLYYFFRNCWELSQG